MNSIDLLNRIQTIDVCIKINNDKIALLDKRDKQYKKKKKRLGRKNGKLMKEQSHLINVIISVNVPDLVLILYKRYIFKKSWTKIQREMHYSESACFNLHRKALAELDRAIQRAEALKFSNTNRRKRADADC